MNVIQFHNLSHIFISLIGALLLFALYRNISTRFSSILAEDDSQKRVDRGLLYLSLSMFVWVISGCLAYFGEAFSFTDTFTYSIGANLLSILNNMCLLLAISYFYYAPSFIYKNEKNVRLILSLIILVTIVTLIVSTVYGDQVISGIRVNAIPDLILSGFLCLLLGMSLYKTFRYRGFSIVAILAVLVVGLVFASQVPEVLTSLDSTFHTNLIKIIAKTSLISIFLVLATTWVIQLANTPKVNEMYIKFQDWSLVKLNIPSKGIKDLPLDFGSKTTQFRNLLKFALRRKWGEGDDQSMLVGSGGEISNQTYLTRIIDNINEVGNLKGDSKLERRDMLTFLGEGKYRLRMLSDHIDVDASLLREFTNSSENQPYKSICNSL